jgi:hypothetical protein
VSITQRSDIGANRIADGAAGPAGWRRPWWVWATPLAVTLGVLVARNASLFSTPEYERADMGANSILIEQARRFTLLVGNYSRRGFNHPGPAFLYVQSWGESVFWALLHAVPTAWNGQLIAVYALNAFFAACAVAVGYGWTRSARGALAAGAVAGLLGAVHPAVFSSDWMPYAYVLPFLVFILALASAVAGRREDAWIAALSGWFLIHGHAAFLFIVPAMVAGPAALLALRAVRRGGLGAWLRDLRGDRRAGLPVAVISALFALPLVLELVLHGDGNFAKYFAYGSSSAAGGHPAAQVADYVLWFWWPGRGAWAAPVLLGAAAVLLTCRLPAGQLKASCWSLLGCDALATALIVAYTVTGVDEIGQHYIGYFCWAAPAVAAAVILLTLTELRPGRAGVALAALAALAAGAAFAVAPGTRTSTSDVDPLNPRAGYPTDPALPHAVAVMGRLAAGRTVVLTFPHDGWTDVTGLLVQAGRTGVSACVADPHWAFLMSASSICTTADLRGGYRMSVYPDADAPRGAHPVARLARAVVTSGTI